MSSPGPHTPVPEGSGLMGSAPHPEREQVWEQGASRSVAIHGVGPWTAPGMKPAPPSPAPRQRGRAELCWAGGQRAGTARTWVSMAVGAQLPAKWARRCQRGKRRGSGALAFKPCHPCRWHVLRVAAAARPPAEAKVWKSGFKKKKKNHNKYREGLTKLRASFPKPRCSSPGAPVCQAACECVSDLQRLVPALDPRSNIVLAGHGLGRFFFGE